MLDTYTIGTGAIIMLRLPLEGVIVGFRKHLYTQSKLHGIEPENFNNSERAYIKSR